MQVCTLCNHYSRWLTVAVILPSLVKQLYKTFYPAAHCCCSPFTLNSLTLESGTLGTCMLFAKFWKNITMPPFDVKLGKKWTHSLRNCFSFLRKVFANWLHAVQLQFVVLIIIFLRKPNIILYNIKIIFLKLVTFHNSIEIVQIYSCIDFSIHECNCPDTMTSFVRSRRHNILHSQEIQRRSSQMLWVYVINCEIINCSAGVPYSS